MMRILTLRRMTKLLAAVVVTVAAAQLEVAVKCHGEPAPGRATSEACTWGRAYLPATRMLYLLIGGPLVYGALTLVERARGRPPRGGSTPPG